MEKKITEGGNKVIIQLIRRFECNINYTGI